jgi:hypothetical protein
MKQALSNLLHRGNVNPGVAIAYLALAGLFCWTLPQFYIPGKGFSFLIAFGDKQEATRLSKVRRLDPYVEKSSYGYDSQYYAQIAMDPSLQNRELAAAVDNLPYRARRILVPAMAHLLGLGRPPWILQAYALLNFICWLALAGVLLWWFPPSGWGNLLRWAGVLFSYGVCVSYRWALIDGPSLLLLVLGLMLWEKQRPRLAVAVLALGGLARETSLLGVAVLAPEAPTDRRAWGRAILRGVLVMVPLALWLVYIAVRIGPATDVGLRNFDLPFTAFFRAWWENLIGLPLVSWGNWASLWNILMLVSLTVQFLYLLLRPRWTQAWWRVGASFAVLMIFLGEAVWEGYPGAASRVLLPMQVAFNVLVPAGLRWLPVLLLGNLTLISAPALLETPPITGYLIKGPDALTHTDKGAPVTVRYQRSWYSVETALADYWCWSPGSNAIDLANPHAQPLQIRLRFSLNTLSRRGVQLRLNGRLCWEAQLFEDNSVTVTLPQLTLMPGLNRLEFITNEPPARIATDPRPLAFSLRNLRLELLRLLPSGAAPP